MVNKYSVNFKKTLTNQASSQINAPIIIDAWLEEGAITVTDAGSYDIKGREGIWDTFAFAARAAKNDLVQLAATDVAYLYESLQGHPIVMKTASSGGIVGQILDYPRGLNYTPPNTAAADTIAKRVAGKYYRLAPIRLDAMWYDTVKVNGQSTPIAVGDHLIYDVSSAAYVKESGTTLSPLVAAHYAATDGIYVGAIKGLQTTTSQS